MLLFFDVISTIPEFYLIEEKKVILNRKILSKQGDKLSDNIFEVYSKLNSELNLTQNLKKIVITNGPGSYTSLRVGSAFVAGLSISKNLTVCEISAQDIIMFKSKNRDINKVCVFIASANDQQFLCTMNNLFKIENNTVNEKKVFIPKKIDTIYYNEHKLNLEYQNVKQYKFSFIDELLLNLDHLNFNNNKILKPIYVSNNKLLN